MLKSAEGFVKPIVSNTKEIRDTPGIFENIRFSTHEKYASIHACHKGLFTALTFHRNRLQFSKNIFYVFLYKLTYRGILYKLSERLFFVTKHMIYLGNTLLHLKVTTLH